MGHWWLRLKEQKIEEEERDEYLMCNVFVSVSGRIYAQGQQHDPVLLRKLDRDDSVVQRR